MIRISSVMTTVKHKPLGTTGRRSRHFSLFRFLRVVRHAAHEQDGMWGLSARAARPGRGRCDQLRLVCVRAAPCGRGRDAKRQKSVRSTRCPQRSHRIGRAGPAACRGRLLGTPSKWLRRSGHAAYARHGSCASSSWSAGLLTAVRPPSGAVWCRRRKRDCIP